MPMQLINMPTEDPNRNSVPPPPEPLDRYNARKQWGGWITRYDRYRVATGLSSRSQRQQVKALLFAMGTCVDDILHRLQPSVNEDASSYAEVKRAFDRHFGVTGPNVIEARAKFNQRAQGAFEGVNSFINDLYCLAEDCEYDEMTEDMIRDRIVAGMSQDNTDFISDRNLTLAEAVHKARLCEDQRDASSTRLVVLGVIAASFVLLSLLQNPNTAKRV